MSGFGSGFSFGATTPATTTANPGFSFGTNTANAPPSTTFGFGNTASTATSAPTSTFGFGNTTTTSTPTFGSNTGAGSSLFGNTGAATTSTPAFGSNTGTTNTFGFGATPAATPSFSFGGTSNTTPSASTPSAFSFGTAANTGQTTTAFGGFGATPAGAQNGGGGFFGGSTAFPTQNQAPPPMDPIQLALRQIMQKYNVNSPDCVFSYIFYDLVNQATPVAKPPHISDYLWKLGVDDNPNPNRLVPTGVNGFKALQERLKKHDESIANHKKFIAQVEESIKGMKQKHEGETKEKIQQYKRKHMELAHRLLRLVCKLESFMNRDVPLYPEEETFHTRLEHVQRELNKPTQFKGRLTELTSVVSMQDDIPQSMFTEQLSDDTLDEVSDYLSQQTQGIQKLNDVLKEDLERVESGLNALRSNTH